MSVDALGGEIRVYEAEGVVFESTCALIATQCGCRRSI
jgi:hypothetical protein